MGTNDKGQLRLSRSKSLVSETQTYPLNDCVAFGKLFTTQNFSPHVLNGLIVPTPCTVQQVKNKIGKELNNRA